MTRKTGLLLCFAAMLACGGQSDIVEIPGWTPASELRIFRGAELYGHINGGSEIFLELGFDRLEVREYSKGESELSVESYHMNDGAAALGIYLMKCGVETSSPEIDARNTTSSMQIHLVHGSSFVTLNNLSGSAEAASALPVFAAQLVATLPPAQPVQLLEALPAEDRVPGSERIIRGPFTLQSLYTFGDGDVLRLAESGATAVAATYGAEPLLTTLILADYGSNAEATATFKHLVDNLDEYLKPIEQSENRLVFEDWDNRIGEISVIDSRLEIRIGAKHEN